MCVQFRDHRLNRSEEIRLKSVAGGIFGRFSNFDNCRPEVAGDVMSGAALVYVGVDVPTKFGDSRSSRSRDIRLPHFVTDDEAHLAFCLKNTKKDL